MAIWIGVDVGGTFTDIVAFDAESGREMTHKVPSTPSNPAQAIVTGIEAILKKHQIDAANVAQVAHGTTVGTNTLIERKGAKVALITTQGFRDVLEIARQKRPSHFDMHRDFPPAVVPRWRRFEVVERILADGTVRTPLTDAEIDRVVAEALATGAEAIGVCLIFSYLWPQHEQALAKALAKASPKTYVSISSEVHPEFREYERSSTATLNAYLQPIMTRYLEDLDGLIRENIPKADVVISQSAGGLMSIARAMRFPIRTALSGPAAGVVGAVRAASTARMSNVITFDMGGTSADVALVRDLEPAQTHDKMVGGLPVRLPSVDISTVGAGGGSIAWFDRDGGLKVGPMSAGAAPGPACYGLGGDKATLTDANLVLGRLSPEGLLGGAMKLDPNASRRVIAPVAEHLGLDIEATARGMVEIVVTNMTRVIRAVSIEKGYDPRALALLAFGGAGPLHASAVAASLEIARVIVPPAPGLLCAEGLIASSLREDFIRTARIRLDNKNSESELLSVLQLLHAQAATWFEAERILGETRSVRAALDVRYVGQSFEIEIPLEGGRRGGLPKLPDSEHVRKLFFEAHERTYGFHNPNAPVEVVNCRLSASGQQHRAQELLPMSAKGNRAEPVGRRAVWFGAGAPTETAIYRRDALIPGQQIAGPAVIEQMDTTTVAFPTDRIAVDDYANLIIEVRR